MLQSFQDVENWVISRGTRKRLVLCGAHDRDALGAVVYARKKGVIDGILIGDKVKILTLLGEAEEDPSLYEIIDKPYDRDSSELAMSFVRDGHADIEMKGQMPSTEYLLPIMNPFDGLMRPGSIMSEITVFYYREQSRIMFATDCALNIAPTLPEKVQLLENAIRLSRAFGFQQINIAAISPLEKVNPQIPSSEDAAAISQKDFGENVVVAGPFALDNALDEKAALSKGSSSRLFS